MARWLPALALSGALMVGACTNPDGTANVPGTLALGAGGVVAGYLLGQAIERENHPRPDHGHAWRREGWRDEGWRHQRWDRASYADGYGRPHGWQHRRW